MGRHVSQSCQTVGMYVLVLLGEGERRRKDEGTYRTVMLSLIKLLVMGHTLSDVNNISKLLCYIPTSL